MRIKTNTRQGAANAIARALDFTTHGALSGRWETLRYDISTGRAPEYVRAVIEAHERDARERGETRVYVVRSYATPVALIFENGSSVYFEHKYTPTTSKHQHYVRAGLDAYAERVARREAVAA